MGTPGPNPGPQPQVQAQGPRQLTVSELVDRIRKAVDSLNSEGVVPQHRLVRISVNGGRVVAEIWVAFEFRNVEVLSEVVGNQVCEGLDIPAQLCAGTRSKARELVIWALREYYTAKDVAVLKLSSRYGRFSVSWLPLPPTDSPINGDLEGTYRVGAKVLVTVELPAYEGIDRDIGFVLGRLEEILYNLY